MTPEQERSFREGAQRNRDFINSILGGTAKSMREAEKAAEGMEESIKPLPRKTIIQKDEIEDVKLFSELGVDEFIKRM